MNEIQKVYRQFAIAPNSVVMSLDDGYTWFTPSVDTGKWFSGIYLDMYTTICWAFLEMK